MCRVLTCVCGDQYFKKNIVHRHSVIYHLKIDVLVLFVSLLFYFPVFVQGELKTELTTCHFRQLHSTLVSFSHLQSSKSIQLIDFVSFLYKNTKCLFIITWGLETLIFFFYSLTLTREGAAIVYQHPFMITRSREDMVISNGLSINKHFLQ